MHAFLFRVYWYIAVPLRRLLYIALVPFFDVVFIERGLLHHCWRPWLEMLLYRWAHAWGRCVVYFIDDPIYIDCPDYVHYLIEKANVVITITEPLAKHALKFNRSVVLFEDAVDTERYPLRKWRLNQKCEEVVIGWVGNAVVGLNYLKPLYPSLLKLVNEYPNLVFRVVSGKDFQFEESGVPVDNVAWRLDYEASVTFDIGVAPLGNTAYDRAKGSYKLLQYWSHGLPVVCSQTADNFLEDGINCLIVKRDDDWYERLRSLISNPDLGKDIGTRGRELIEARFSLAVKGPVFSGMIRDIVEDQSKVEFYKP